MHRVVIVGGGFGGMYATRALRRTAVELTLVDRRNHHLFQPLLYQVATGTLSPANIAAPLRSMVRKQTNARVLLAEVRGLDLVRRTVLLDDGELAYDTLVLAAGSTHSYFGHDEWAEFAPGLKTLDDATAIRRQVLLAFEAAERAGGGSKARSWLTFVIVGGGPTGVEMAGAVAEIARHTLRRDFRNIDPSEARVILVEAVDRILPPFDAALSEYSRRALEKLGVTVATQSTVTRITNDMVWLRQGDLTEEIATKTVIWAAGVKASPLSKIVADQAGVELDRAGRIPVNQHLHVNGHPELFVIGDMAHFEYQPGQVLPALAPVAMQEGAYVARIIESRLRNSEAKPFKFRDRGTMATIGRFKAVAQVGGWKFTGMTAWLMWLFVHLMYIVQFQHRLMVLMQWAAHYISWNRSARLITGEATAIIDLNTPVKDSRQPRSLSTESIRVEPTTVP